MKLGRAGRRELPAKRMSSRAKHILDMLQDMKINVRQFVREQISLSSRGTGVALLLPG
jgi:hypothetical protein